MPDPEFAICTWDYNSYPEIWRGTFPFELTPHATLRVGRDKYLEADHSARRYYGKGSTGVTHVVRKGRVSWILGATIRHGRKY
jgi:hypothetical protein